MWPAVGKEPPHTTVHPGTFNGMDTTEVASFPGLCPAGGEPGNEAITDAGRTNYLQLCTAHSTQQIKYPRTHQTQLVRYQLATCHKSSRGPGAGGIK